MSITNLLEQHPIAALATGATGIIPSLIESALPIVQLIAAALGTCVIAVTLAIKIRHYRRDKDL